MACTLVTLWRAKFSGTETTKRRKMYDCFDCSKGIIVFTNVLFVLLGGVLISIGGYMLDIPDLHAFSTGGIAFGIIACGIMILLIAILGCCGAQCQSKMFLCPYAALVLVSIVAQLVLAGIMYHLHVALQNVSDGSISHSDEQVLHWIQNRFDQVYDNCEPVFHIGKSIVAEHIVLECRDYRYKWFEVFAEKYCYLNQKDLVPGSAFLACAGESYVAKSLTQVGLFCACQTQIVNWVNDQSSLIGIIAIFVGIFEIVLVLLSCVLLCAQHRRHGYQEIRTSNKNRPSYAGSQHDMLPYAQPMIKKSPRIQKQG